MKPAVLQISKVKALPRDPILSYIPWEKAEIILNREASLLVLVSTVTQPWKAKGLRLQLM